MFLQGDLNKKKSEDDTSFCYKVDNRMFSSTKVRPIFAFLISSWKYFIVLEKTNIEFRI